MTEKKEETKQNEKEGPVKTTCASWGTEDPKLRKIHCFSLSDKERKV